MPEMTMWLILLGIFLISILVYERKTAPAAAKNILIEKSRAKTTYSKTDFVLLTLIIAAYAFAAFYRLEDTKAALAVWFPSPNDMIVVDFGKEYELSNFAYMANAKHDQSFLIEFSSDDETYIESASYTIYHADVFCWQEKPLSGSYRYVRITAETGELRLNEMAFRDLSDKIIPIKEIIGSNGCEKLFDEQELVPYDRTYMNSTIFDEIYHARTAYELLHDLQAYETTHPPFGKEINLIGIAIFGMTPFGWRFCGTLFGVLMLPMLYVFAKRLFKHSF